MVEHENEVGSDYCHRCYVALYDVRDRNTLPVERDGGREHNMLRCIVTWLQRDAIGAHELAAEIGRRWAFPPTTRVDKWGVPRELSDADRAAMYWGRQL